LVALISRIVIADNVDRLTTIDDTTGIVTSSATGLTIAYRSNVGLVGGVTIASDNYALIVVNDSSSIGMSGERYAQCSEAQTDNKQRFEVHDFKVSSDRSWFLFALQTTKFDS
jgi:hypothetical protein